MGSQTIITPYLHVIYDKNQSFISIIVILMSSVHLIISEEDDSISEDELLSSATINYLSTVEGECKIKVYNFLSVSKLKAVVVSHSPS